MLWQVASPNPCESTGLQLQQCARALLQKYVFKGIGTYGQNFNHQSNFKFRILDATDQSADKAVPGAQCRYSARGAPFIALHRRYWPSLPASQFIRCISQNSNHSAERS